ncbi:uncharacterized protein LOC130677186 [Microplitis mediator]|uniref:uncharacterized protein LOC130677186 n=1 Tax=Microplitis mediator TaxID=375433 RepID=UPI0025568D84|nr:uncharacterized protein LOC130677186 [Microplitis mediator]
MNVITNGIKNDFLVGKNENGEYCLKNICEHTNLSYKDSHWKFQKDYITRDELNSILQRNEKYLGVVQFKKKLQLIEEYEWIEKVAVIIKDKNFDLQIDNLFITLWTALEKKRVYIDSLLLKFMGFDDINFEFNFDKQLSKFVEFLKTNEIDHKREEVSSNEFEKNVSSPIFLTVDNFKYCIMLLNNCRAKEVKNYYIKLERIFDCYKNYIAKLEIHKLRNENRELLKQNQELKKKFNEIEPQLNEKETQLNEKNTQLNEPIRINSSIATVLDNIKMPNPDGYIYIATTIQYARQNIFKIGFTVDLNTRLSGLNTGKISTDRLYYSYYKKTFNVRKIEKMIHNLLVDYRDSPKNEFFKLHYTYLSEIVKFVINNTHKPYEQITDFVKDKLKDVYNLRPIVPPEMPIPNYNGLSESEIINTFTKIIIHYGDSQVYEIKWKKLVSDLQQKLRSKLKTRKVWDLFKTQFNWQSSTTPICYEGYQIIVVY